MFLTEVSDAQKKQIMDLDQGHLHYHWSEKAWSDFWAQSDSSLYWIDIVEGPQTQKVDGFSLWLISKDEALAHLLKIVVHPEKRREGLALSLFENASKYFASVGVHRYYLEVAEDNVSAQELYRKMGFVVVRRVKKLYRDGANGVIMMLDKE